MNTYLISYDLIKPETSPEYARLFQLLRSFPQWAKVLRSVWLIKTDQSSGEVMDMLRGATDSNDKILVIEVTNNWWTYNVLKEVSDWMKGNL